MKTKTSKNRVIILGSGTSTGIPQLCCSCTVCTSTKQVNKRLRCSIFLETASNNKAILIDTTPDLRFQLLNNQIKRIDATIITHDHADHLHGIDDLRPFCFGPPRRKIPIFTPTDTKNAMEERFPYIFQADKLFSNERPILGGGIPDLELNEIKFSNDPIISAVIEGEKFKFFLLPHGYSKTLGFIHHGLAYISDCCSVPEPILEYLVNYPPNLLIIECIQKRPHDTHLHVDLTFELIKKINPQQAGLIHMNHDLEHVELLKLCQKTFNFPVFPLYDGQILQYENFSDLK